MSCDLWLKYDEGDANTKRKHQISKYTSKTVHIIGVRSKELYKGQHIWAIPSPTLTLLTPTWGLLVTACKPSGWKPCVITPNARMRYVTQRATSRMEFITISSHRSNFVPFLGVISTVRNQLSHRSEQTQFFSCIFFCRLWFPCWTNFFYGRKLSVVGELEASDATKLY